MDSPPPSPPPPKRVLLITNSEHGQANVYLAVAYALMTLPDEDVQVHFASFTPIADNVQQTSAHALAAKPSARPMIFHTLDGLPMREAWARPEVSGQLDALDGVNTLEYAMKRTWMLLRITLPWTGPELVQLFESVRGLVEEVDPDISAVDPAFAPGLTALRYLKRKAVILTPNTIKDFAMVQQPGLESLWKYPCVGKAYEYPVPLAQIPANIILILVVVICGLLDPHRRTVQTYVRTHADGAELTTLSDLTLAPRVAAKVLVANRPELEFPLKVIPPHVVPCGPMIRPAAPVAAVDPDLAAWLARGPTVYINLGTHATFSRAFAAEMAGALRVLFDHAAAVRWRDKSLEGLQVLWKVRAEGEWSLEDTVRPVLGGEMERDVVRAVAWVEAEPTAVLETGTVVCAVHHGGANSFLEVVNAGVPMIVLPAWMDCFDFARRAEVLGIGRWGNRTASKACRAAELGPILVDMLFGGQRSVYAARARELAAVCREHGGGRLVAARIILGEIPPPKEEEEEEEGDEVGDETETETETEKSDLLVQADGSMTKEYE